MIEQMLFGESLTLPPAERREARKSERLRKAKMAYDATSATWKKATYRFAVEVFLPRHNTFLFEDLTIAYNAAVKTQNLPATVNGKAFAGLQRILIREGRIEALTGQTGTRSNGQVGPIYRSGLYQQGATLG